MKEQRKTRIDNLLQKEAVLGAPAAYEKYIGRVPAMEASVLGTAGSVLGYHGSGFIAERMARALTAGMSPSQKAAEMRRLERDGTLDKIRGWGGTLGGGLGLAYVLGQKGDFSNGVSGLWKSMNDPKYSKTPESQAVRKKNETDQIQGATYDADRTYEKSASADIDDYTGTLADLIEDTLMDKEASYSMHDGYSNDRIPIDYTTDLLVHNPFIELKQKSQAINILQDAEPADSGLTTGQHILTSAVKAGVGYGAAGLLANTFGTIIGMPDGMRKNLRMVAGVTGALENNGIFNF